MRKLLLAGIAAGLYGAPPALAQDQDDDRRPRFEISLGAFFARSSTGLRVDSTALGRGTQINLEDDLGFDADETAFRVDGLLRFGERRRHRIDASYFALTRKAGRVIDQQVQFGDQVFDVNADVRAELGLDIFKLDYTYMFVQRDNVELGASIGVFGIGQNASLSESTRGIVEASDFTFPLPTIGARGDVNLTPRLLLKASVDVFFIDTGEYTGELYDLLVGLEYDIFEHVGLGVAYNYADMGLGASRDEGDVDLGLTYDGALAYVKLAF